MSSVFVRLSSIICNKEASFGVPSAAPWLDSSAGLPQSPQYCSGHSSTACGHECMLLRNMQRRLEDEEGLVLTPFEKNLEVWRQLWRVLERSDIVVQASHPAVLISSCPQACTC